MASVEHFFLGCGITMFSLGLIACLIPGSSKRGVIAMLTGDACFLLAISYPRYFSQFSVFAQNWLNYALLGVAVGSGSGCLWLLPGALRQFWQKRGKKNLPNNAVLQEAVTQFSNEHAPATLFSSVKKEEKSTEKDIVSSTIFSGIKRKDHLC